jgi:hypothetical protein
MDGCVILLGAGGVSEKVGGLDRLVTLDRLLGGDGRQRLLRAAELRTTAWEAYLSQ